MSPQSRDELERRKLLGLLNEDDGELGIFGSSEGIVEALDNEQLEEANRSLAAALVELAHQAMKPPPQEASIVRDAEATSKPSQTQVSLGGASGNRSSTGPAKVRHRRLEGNRFAE